MRYGFTTGSCAAAAAKAAAYMLLMGREKTEISIDTPKGIPYHAKVTDICRREKSVSCAVIKDGGDDPDITTGAHIAAEVSFSELSGITIAGGRGVGVVTKPGLDQPVGNAAINRVPRAMIEKEVTEVCRFADYKGGLFVEISVPEGEALAEQTFNPRLGIVGGISILGTSGIVEPMSSQALLDTIRVELRQKYAEGQRIVAVSPGNYGLEYMKRTYGYDLDRSVKCSNFIGQTIDMAAECGFETMLLTGHIGKLIKVSGGIMNTHSKEGDCRMELLAAAALKAGADRETLLSLLEAVATEEAVRILKEKNLCEKTMELVMEKIMFYLQKRAGGKMKIACMMYANEFGELGKSSEAEAFLRKIMEG
ncbi:MAG: cobalamin biosynthesis protein CbiD [Roseburia sp.]|nr:cobalamin biosynthesis protein CbiD [Roseburia sp.]